jgi:hypothetical protein
VTAVDQDWRIHGVSVQGYSHLRDGKECQDAYRHGYVEEVGAHVLAVSDGAGSRARSAEGAALAVGLAVRTLGDALLAHGVPGSAPDWHALLGAAYEEVLQAFGTVTATLGGHPKEFAATLTVVVLAHPWVGVMSIGDGFVVTRVGGAREGDRYHLLEFDDTESEFVNETVFLSSSSARTAVTIGCAYDPDLTAVLLATDGLAGAGVRQEGPRRRPNPSFFEPVLRALDDPTKIARFLFDDALTAVGADDKTLLMAVAR